MFDNNDDERKAKMIAQMMEQVLGGSVEVLPLGEMGSDPDNEPDGIGKLNIMPEAAIERLRDFQKRYVGKCPYKVGDLVTVRSDAPLSGKGVPHIVMEVRELGEKEGMFHQRLLGTPFFGARYNIRCATVTEKRSHIVAYWMDWADLQDYKLPEPEAEGASE